MTVKAYVINHRLFVTNLEYLMPTMIDIRNCTDTDNRQYQIVDVLEPGATLPHSIPIYEWQGVDADALNKIVTELAAEPAPALPRLYEADYMEQWLEIGEASAMACGTSNLDYNPAQQKIIADYKAEQAALPEDKQDRGWNCLGLAVEVAKAKGKDDEPADDHWYHDNPNF